MAAPRVIDPPITHAIAATTGIPHVPVCRDPYRVLDPAIWDTWVRLAGLGQVVPRMIDHGRAEAGGSARPHPILGPASPVDRE